MEITKINVRPLPQRLERLAGTASIVLDNMLAINDIKILYIEKDRRFFIEFPNDYKAKKERREIIAPLTKEAREYIENKVLKEFFTQDKIQNGRLFTV
ncbi:MAG: septation protein SpoVG family protein [Acutalibacteraceae bacterium]|nr:septation protein SpoVG family protein [Acutalibacteraceae bacterium]